MTTKKSLTDMVKAEMDKPIAEEGEAKTPHRPTSSKTNREAEVQRLEEALKISQEQVSLLTTDRDHLKQNLEELAANHAQALAALTEEYNTLKANLLKTQAQNQSQQEQITQLQAYLDQAHNLKEALERAEAEKQILNTELAQYRHKLVARPQIARRPIASNQDHKDLTNQTIGWFD